MAARASVSGPFPATQPLTSAVGAAFNADFLAPEEAAVRRLCDQARLAPEQQAQVQAHALQLVMGVRGARSGGGGIDALMRQYHLASAEGVILMCLAEALLRIPDAYTADRLIADKLSEGDWESYLGDSDSLLVNASTWGLMLTGRLVEVDRTELGSMRGWFGRLAARISEPVARAALRQAMRVLGHQFVMGRNIGEALQRTAGRNESRYAYSFDMLGEAAITAPDAQHYLEKYRDAIADIGRHVQQLPDGVKRPGISVKLSALHPRYEFLQRDRVLRELGPRLAQLVAQARAAGIALTVDAEEADRLELSLQLIDRILTGELLQGYAGFGLAVQAYQKRAFGALQWLIGRTQQLGRRITVRLVKGAYWDTEIKRAQERGLAGFPVFLSCLRAPARRQPGCDLSAVRHAQCAHRGVCVPDPVRGWTCALRIPETARNGGGALRAGHRRARSGAGAGSPVPCVRPRGAARGSAAVPGPPPAREWRQHLLCESHHG